MHVLKLCTFSSLLMAEITRNRNGHTRSAKYPHFGIFNVVNRPCDQAQQQPQETSPQHPGVVRLHVNAFYFLTTVRRVTSPTWVLPPPLKQALSWVCRVWLSVSGVGRARKILLSLPSPPPPLWPRNQCPRPPCKSLPLSLSLSKKKIIIITKKYWVLIHLKKTTPLRQKPFLR